MPGQRIYIPIPKDELKPRGPKPTIIDENIQTSVIEDYKRGVKRGRIMKNYDLTQYRVAMIIKQYVDETLAAQRAAREPQN